MYPQTFEGFIRQSCFSSVFKISGVHLASTSFKSCVLTLLFAEDEQQQKTLSCSKSVRQLTLERDQAMADLNSVERSFADLFRRYENMKGVLEGFKKVSTASI